jgi:anti-anti-sigma factor
VKISAPLSTLDLCGVLSNNEAALALRGELDFGNHEQLKNDLAGLEPDGPTTVRVDMSRLEFCDVSAFRHLVEFAGQVHDKGGWVVVTGARPIIKTMAAVFDAGEALEFSAGPRPDCPRPGR